MTAVSALYVPGSRPDRFDRAAASGADVVILDLEDSVAAEDKAAARDAVAAWLPGAPVAVQVRVNAPGADALTADLAALPPDAVLRVPKVSGTDDLDAVDGREVHAILESALGIERAFAIAGHPAVRSLTLGEADLAAELGLEGEDAFAWLRSRVVVAARAAGHHRDAHEQRQPDADQVGDPAVDRRGDREHQHVEADRPGGHAHPDIEVGRHARQHDRRGRRPHPGEPEEGPQEQRCTTRVGGGHEWPQHRDRARDSDTTCAPVSSVAKRILDQAVVQGRTIPSARRRIASSTIEPSASRATPAEDSTASTSCAQATSASVGANASRMTGTWAGCTALRPWKPSRRPTAQE